MGKSIEDRKMAAFEDILEELKEIAEEARCICKAFRELISLLFPVPTSIKINQIGGSSDMAITGIVVGATGTFQESPSAPPGAVEPAGTTRVWTTSDSVNTALTPSADGTTVAVAVLATAPVGSSFVLTITDTFPDGKTATGSATVPFLPVPAPEPTALAVNQLS
jgi:hypothetical protein